MPPLSQPQWEQLIQADVTFSLNSLLFQRCQLHSHLLWLLHKSSLFPSGRGPAKNHSSKQTENASALLFIFAFCFTRKHCSAIRDTVIIIVIIIIISSISTSTIWAQTQSASSSLDVTPCDPPEPTCSTMFAPSDGHLSSWSWQTFVGRKALEHIGTMHPCHTVECSNEERGGPAMARSV